jgi:hypothetical protein
LIDILDYANTNKYKTLRVLMVDDWKWCWRISISVWYFGCNTDAITSITINFIGNKWQVIEYSHFALYGIKEA